MLLINLFCNFLRCLIHEVSASHKPPRDTRINSVIHIPPQPFFCMSISDTPTDSVIIFYMM